ncbi:hypothetical protein [Peteryoungia ipomoeae]|uniref:N-glycosylase/DNA lyase n=1 Tax=Peteryoungia ipomoeae TaxID=1210932 RepID=A0A4S8P4R8_9HYPH|nr:hypothetical protein [Peteryoungia ipomoeae]THV25087.1 hypothetical protein FAA97_02465 [Peteryoungia ipomoeae]
MADAKVSGRKITEHYHEAKRWVNMSEYSAEINWQSTRLPGIVTETDFLREYAWVVLNSGFREMIVRKKFDYISLCYCDWDSAEEIVSNASVCVRAAAHALNHRQKLEAIVKAAAIVSRTGFSSFWNVVMEAPQDRLQTLPFIGPVTARHLAKNLGFSCVKPDRHLVRLATEYGFVDVDAMCEAIQVESGDDLSVLDIVLWRYEEQRSLHRYR